MPASDVSSPGFIGEMACLSTNAGVSRQKLANKRKAFARRSCSVKNLERDGDSTESRRAPGKADQRPAGASPASRRRRACKAITSIIGGEIVDDLADVAFVDRRSVDFDHLGDLGLPEILLRFQGARLGLDVVARVTRRAIVLNDLDAGRGLELR